MSAGAQRPLAMTMGDPAGIGPEIAIKAWLARGRIPIPKFALYADADLVAERAAVCGAELAVARIDTVDEAFAAFDQALPVIDVALAEPSRPGEAIAANATAVIQSIERAVGDVAAGRADAVVTNPIAKSVLYAAGFRHPGHTEFLGELAVRHWPLSMPAPMMLLAAETPEVTLRVVPLSIHVPLSEAPSRVTEAAIVATAMALAAALTRDFGIASPRIAVAGLNPHAGEGGAIGAEDRDVIAPAIARLVAKGMHVFGPLSADAMFHAGARAAYDAAIAMYHDQALIPLKTLAFESGVNVTLGLPFVRTSPDHGTAFGIAGSGKASPSSLIAALGLADRMAARRAGRAPLTVR